jgi:hypothetical protein
VSEAPVKEGGAERWWDEAAAWEGNALCTLSQKS